MFSLNDQSEVLIDFHKSDFIIGTESHLDDSDLSAEVFRSHYTVGETETDMEVVFLFWPNTTYHHHFSNHLHQLN